MQSLIKNLWAIGIFVAATGIVTLQAAEEKKIIQTPESKKIQAQFERAVNRGDIKQVKELLTKPGINVNGLDATNNIPLIIASAKGYKDIVELLLKNKAAVDKTNEGGNTALMLAAGYGFPEIVELLLEHGANISSQNEEGLNALIAAANEGHLKVVRLLLSKKSPVNVQTINGWSALMGAAVEGDLETVNLLLAHKANPDLIDKYGDDARSLALKYGQKEVYNALVEHRKTSEATQPTTNKLQALFASAVDKSTIKLIEPLLHKPGVDINAPLNARGSNALSIASLRDRDDIVELLLKNGAAVNALDNKDVSALMLAAGLGHLNIVQLLLNNWGAELNLQDINGNSALSLAAHHPAGENSNFPAIVELLINHGAQVNNLDNSNTTPLIRAASKRNTEIVRILLENGAQVNHQNKYGDPALTFAVDNQDIDTIRLLLSYGANVDLENQECQSPRSLARKFGNRALVTLLAGTAETKKAEKTPRKNINKNSLEALIKEGNFETLTKDLHMLDVFKQESLVKTIFKDVVGDNNCDAARYLVANHGAIITETHYKVAMDNQAMFDCLTNLDTNEEQKEDWIKKLHAYQLKKEQKRALEEEAARIRAQQRAQEQERERIQAEEAEEKQYKEQKEFKEELEEKEAQRRSDSDGDGKPGKLEKNVKKQVCISPRKEKKHKHKQKQKSLPATPEPVKPVAKEKEDIVTQQLLKSYPGFAKATPGSRAKISATPTKQQGPGERELTAAMSSARSISPTQAELEEREKHAKAIKNLAKTSDSSRSTTPEQDYVELPVLGSDATLRLNKTHIFEGAVGRSGRLTGVHHDYLGERQQRGEIGLPQTYLGGIYRARVQGKQKPSTFFPQNWTQDEVLTAIWQALQNPIAKAREDAPHDAYTVVGTYNHPQTGPMKIKIVFGRDGTIITAYPILEGAVPATHNVLPANIYQKTK